MNSLTDEQILNISQIEDVTLRELFTAFFNLQPGLRDYFTSEAVAMSMSSIWENHQLTPDKSHEAAKVVGLVMLGKINVKDFVRELAKRSAISSEQARPIAQDINERIFQPVREELLQVHGISEQGEKTETAYQAPQPVAQTPELRTAPVATPMPVQESDEAAKQKRDELLARLRAAQDAPMQQTQPPAQQQQSVQPPQEPEPPKPVTAAWNGKTIDLSKIPPRRVLNGNGQKNGEEEIRTVQLKKGPDGYWYEI